MMILKTTHGRRLFMKEAQIQKLDIQIMECHAMIDHFIQLKQRGVEYATEEIKYWRGYLQNAKLMKRKILNT